MSLKEKQRMTQFTLRPLIDRNNRYDGFSTTENITVDKVVDFLDRLSFRIKKNTFVVLDNARVHRCKLMAELRAIWDEDCFFSSCFHTRHI